TPAIQQEFPKDGSCATSAARKRNPSRTRVAVYRRLIEKARRAYGEPFMSEATETRSSADSIKWDLGDLYSSVDDPRIQQDLDGAMKRAQAFETAYRGKIDVPGGPPAELLRDALVELESLYEQADRADVYASLLHSAQTDEPRHGALVSRSQEQGTQINKHLIFFRREGGRLADEAARRLLDDPALARSRHYLEQVRLRKPHMLGEPEEKILDEKALTGRAAFTRLFDESLAAIE